MEVGKKVTGWVYKWKVLCLIVFLTHACMCLAEVVVGGIIFWGFRTKGVAAAADGLRYTGHLLAFLLGLYIVITMIVHWGGKIIRWVFIIEFIAFLGQFFAWMLGANSARLIKGADYHYKLAIASTIIGVFLSFMTLYLTLALFFGRDEMSELVDDDDAVPSAA